MPLLLLLLLLVSPASYAEDILPPDEGDGGVAEAPPPRIVVKDKDPKKATPPPTVIVPETGDVTATEYNGVILQGLNKVIGHISKIDAPVGQQVRFGNLLITPHRCWQSSPEDRPENAALLEIDQIKAGEPQTRIFLGWMFSSTPALSALEDPVYDITVIGCETIKSLEKTPEKTVEKKAEKKVEKK